MGTRKTLSKIQSGSRTYYLLTTLYDEGRQGMDLALSDTEKAWAASASVDDLNDLCRKVKMDFEDYVEQSKKALTNENVGGFDFQYQVKLQGDEATLIWKKHMTSENIKFQLGQLVFQEKDDSSEVIQILFDSAIESSSQLKEKITSLGADNERLATERASALKRLEKCVAVKEAIENNMYTKFAAVINSKKAKIRNIKDELEEARSGAPGTSAAGTSGNASSSPSSKKRPIESDQENVESEEENQRNKSDSEYETDEEKEQVASRKKQKKVKSEIKSEPHSVDKDTSLVLDAGIDEEDEPLPAAARRRRRNPPARKNTPSKPVIPKVSTPKIKAGGTPSRGEMRKSSSRASYSSNRSSDNLDDPDNLVDFM